MTKIYLDHNATTPCPPSVIEAMIPYFATNFGNASSIHQIGQSARKAVEEARAIMAKLINAESPEEIIFTSGGTEANNMAIKGSFEAKKISGKRVVSSTIAHSAIRNVLQHMSKAGHIDYVPVPVLSNALIDVKALEDAMTPDTFLVSIMAANNEVGTIQPIAEIAKLCKKKNIPFHTDAVQAVGKFHIDVQALGVDMLSLSGHKFGAPKGIGILYVRKGTRMESLIDGGRQEKNRRGGTENVPGIAGMAKAAQLVMAHEDEDRSELKALRDEFEQSILKIIPLTSVNGDKNARVCNTSNICFEYTDSTEMLMALDLAGIICSNGSACHAGSPEPSHVLLAMGLPQDKAHGSLRFSLGHDIHKEQVHEAVKTIADVVQRLRKKHPLWKETA